METSPYFTLDDALWPFVYIRLRGSPTNDQFTEYLEALSRCLARRKPHLVVLDMLEARFATREQLHQMAQWATKHEAELRAHGLGTGFIVASPFIRLGMNVIFSLSPSTLPYFVSPTPRPAIAWGTERLEEAGLRECAHRVRLHHGLASARTG